MISADALFSVLSDLTRLRALVLIAEEGEVCVCELTVALDEPQPKISRHLALMREAGVVEARREGTWMHYRLAPTLPEWGVEFIELAQKRLVSSSPFEEDRERLRDMNNRPEKSCA